MQPDQELPFRESIQPVALVQDARNLVPQPRPGRAMIWDRHGPVAGQNVIFDIRAGQNTGGAWIEWLYLKRPTIATLAMNLTESAILGGGAAMFTVPMSEIAHQWTSVKANFFLPPTNTTVLQPAQSEFRNLLIRPGRQLRFVTNLVNLETEIQAMIHDLAPAGPEG